MGGGGGMLKNDASLSFSVQEQNWGVDLATVTIYTYMNECTIVHVMNCVDIIIIIIGITTSLHYANIN